MVLVVTHILAKDKLRVRFPLPAPQQRMSYIIQYESQGTAVNPWASNSTYINVTGGSDLLTGQPQKLCPPNLEVWQSPVYCSSLENCRP
jgi:hypothetical protein